MLYDVATPNTKKKKKWWRITIHHPPAGDRASHIYIKMYICIMLSLNSIVI